MYMYIGERIRAQKCVVVMSDERIGEHEWRVRIVGAIENCTKLKGILGNATLSWSWMF